MSHPTIAEIIAERDALRLSVVQYKTDRATLESEHRKMQDERDRANARLAELLDAKMEYPCHYGKQHKPEDKCIYCERDQALAELSDLKTLYASECVTHVSAKQVIAALKAELAAERERANEAARGSLRYREAVNAERDAARAEAADAIAQLAAERAATSDAQRIARDARDRVALLEGLIREALNLTQ